MVLRQLLVYRAWHGLLPTSRPHGIIVCHGMVVSHGMADRMGSLPAGSLPALRHGFLPASREAIYEMADRIGPERSSLG